jgi:hypothetical protein
MRAKVMRVLRRAALGALVIGAAFSALMAFAHTKLGRPLLLAMRPLMAARAGGGSAACPLGFDRVATPAERAAAQRRFASMHAGSERARERPALGFVLERTNRLSLIAWAAQHGVRCERRARGGPDLACENVPLSSLPEARGDEGGVLEALWFELGPDDRLVSVVALERETTARAAASRHAYEVDALERALGVTAAREGDEHAEALGAGPLRQSSAELRFRDYYAVARATNLGSSYLVSIEFRALPT